MPNPEMIGSGPWYWPYVQYEDVALKAIRTAFYVVIFAILADAIPATISLVSDTTIFRMSPYWSYFDAVAFTILAPFVWRKSRRACIAALVLLIAEALLAFAIGLASPLTVFVRCILGVYVLNGARAAAALGKAAEPAVAGQH